MIFYPQVCYPSWLAGVGFLEMPEQREKEKPMTVLVEAVCLALSCLKFSSLHMTSLYLRIQPFPIQIFVYLRPLNLMLKEQTLHPQNPEKT